MSVKEMFSQIGDYEEAMSRLMNDDILKRFVVKFLADQSYGGFKEALAEENYPVAFRQIHTLKGVAANLGLTKLMEQASVITELLRDQNPHDVTKEVELLDQVYADTCKVIREILAM